MDDTSESLEAPGAHHDPILVQVDDDWRPARLQQWLRDGSGALWADVSWAGTDGQDATIRLPGQRVWTVE